MVNSERADFGSVGLLALLSSVVARGGRTRLRGGGVSAIRSFRSFEDPLLPPAPPLLLLAFLGLSASLCYLLLAALESLELATALDS